MQNILTIIDDFYPDPDLIRKFALGQKFVKFSNSNEKSNAGYNGFYYQPGPETQKALMDKIAKCLRLKLAYNLESQGHFRLLNEKQEKNKTTSIHVDHVQWSGVLSLIPPHLPQGHTQFWRHKKSGLLGIHDPLKIEKAQLENPGLHIGHEESKKLKAWEKTMSAAYNFNRLILFNGNLFHSSAPGFGTTKHNSKLTQTFFFFEKGQQPKNLNINWTYSSP